MTAQENRLLSPGTSESCSAGRFRCQPRDFWPFNKALEDLIVPFFGRGEILKSILCFEQTKYLWLHVSHLLSGVENHGPNAKFVLIRVWIKCLGIPIIRWLILNRYGNLWPHRASEPASPRSQIFPSDSLPSTRCSWQNWSWSIN